MNFRQPKVCVLFGAFFTLPRSLKALTDCQYTPKKRKFECCSRPSVAYYKPISIKRHLTATLVLLTWRNVKVRLFKDVRTPNFNFPMICRLIFATSGTKY